MPSRYFEIRFNDLSFEKQEELINSVKESLLEEYQEEVRRLCKNKLSWQENFCRMNDIDFLMWEEAEDAKVFDWNLAVEEYAEEQAELKVVSGFKYVEVEVETE